MNDHFVDWYRLAAIEPTNDRLERRWKAIEKFGAAMTELRVLDLVRIYFNQPVKSDSKKQYIAAFKDEDPTFSIVDNDLEIRVLAGASLLALLLMDENSSEKDIAALAIVARAFHGAVGPIVNPAVVEKALDYISEEAIRVRSYEETTISNDTVDDVGKLIEEIKTASTNNNFSTAGAALTTLLQNLAASLETIVTESADGNASLSAQISAQKEQTDVLWWLFGEFSRDEMVPFKSIGKMGAPIVFGKELADLTHLPPALYAIEGFIVKAVSLSGNEATAKIRITDSINDVPKEKRAAYLRPSRIADVVDLCPLHFGITKSLEVENPETWKEIVEAGLGTSPELAMTPVQIGLQFYFERMLISTLE